MRGAALPSTVCVTGAAGFIGSWLVMRLLDRGYTVRATVRDPANMKKVKHLLDLPKAETNLTLWKADMTEEGSFDEAIQGCSGVFHVATPMDFESKDPENEVIIPTINGVLSIINSCTKSKTVKRLVFTSSAGTVNVQETQKPEYDESDWSDLDFIAKKKMTAWMYFVSKTLAELAAREAAKENNIDFISIIPTLVVGPFIMPAFPPSLITKERNNGSKEKSSFERFLTTFIVGKRGVMSPSFDMLFGSPVVLDALAKGFIVKKCQKKLLNGSITQEEFIEFEIVVPPGSALLFPSENSVGIEAINFEVKNLIVLDGTWSKAKRIYSENPWLKVLPHLRLNLDNMSLYSEVRRQPKVGYLSTLESIVYAMKGLGDETDGLYNLLEVFESMVGDQRRCKDERLKNFLEPTSSDTHLSKHMTAPDNV